MLLNTMLTVVPILVATFGTFPKGLEKGTGRAGSRRKNLDNRIAVFGQNTEKSSGCVMRIAVNQSQ